MLAEESANNICRAVLLTLVLNLWHLQCVECNSGGKYLASYLTLPIGITFIEIYHMHGGPVQPNIKWIVECFDQQALIGFKDTGTDYTELETVKCRTTFRAKPPTNGYYPYYDRCALHNLTGNEDYYCFNPELHPNSINTFVTAMWDDDPWFRTWLLRTPKTSSGSAFKCCGLPAGYYIDYGGCFTRFTHDDTWEYYDLIYFVMECPENFVMTGMGWNEDPNDEDPHYDWMQCCPVYYDQLTIGVAHLRGFPFDIPPYLKKNSTVTATPASSATTARPSSVVSATAATSGASGAASTAQINNSSAQIMVPMRMMTAVEKVSLKNAPGATRGKSKIGQDSLVINDAKIKLNKRADPQQLTQQQQQRQLEIPSLGTSLVQYMNALASRKQTQKFTVATSSAASLGSHHSAEAPMLVISPNKNLGKRKSNNIDDAEEYRYFERRLNG